MDVVGKDFVNGIGQGGVNRLAEDAGTLESLLNLGFDAGINLVSAKGDGGENEDSENCGHGLSIAGGYRIETMTKLAELMAKLPEGSYRLDEPLARHTTVAIGGPADVWYEARTSNDLIKAVALAKESGVPVTVVGWGSNVLVGDKGIRGLVIHNASNEITIDIQERKKSKAQSKVAEARWQADKTQGTFKYDFGDLNYAESDRPRVEVIVDSGVSLPFLIKYLLHHGVTGLQWFAGIPGTVGGAIFNNIHGGTRFFSEIVSEVTVLDGGGEIKTLSGADLGLDYDRSRFHKMKEVIVKAKLCLFKGDKERATVAAAEWARRKKIQPRNSPGCVFKNIINEDKERLGYPTTGVGYIVEHVLKMGGFRIGDAVVSTAHHNFIVNAGKATAADYLAVMQEIQKRAKAEIGIDLESEIFLLGEF